MSSVIWYSCPPLLPTCAQSNKQPSLRLPPIPLQLCWHDKERSEHSDDKLWSCIKQPPPLYRSTKTGSHVTCPLYLSLCTGRAVFALFLLCSLIYPHHLHRYLPQLLSSSYWVDHHLPCCAASTSSLAHCFRRLHRGIGNHLRVLGTVWCISSFLFISRFLPKLLCSVQCNLSQVRTMSWSLLYLVVQHVNKTPSWGLFKVVGVI